MKRRSVARLKTNAKKVQGTFLEAGHIGEGGVFTTNFAGICAGIGV